MGKEVQLVLLKKKMDILKLGYITKEEINITLNIGTIHVHHKKRQLYHINIL